MMGGKVPVETVKSKVRGLANEWMYHSRAMTVSLVVETCSKDRHDLLTTQFRLLKNHHLAEGHSSTDGYLFIGICVPRKRF